MDLTGFFRRNVGKANLTSGLRKGTKHRAMRVEPLEQRALLAVIAVDSLDDGPVNTADGNTTLRDALALAADVANPDADEITFDASLELDTTPGTITLTEGELVVDSNLVIEGPGASQLTIDADGAGRVFGIADGVSATLRGLTITGGEAHIPGSGIYNSTGTLAVDSCTICDNDSNGIYNESGSLTVVGSAISDNHNDRDYSANASGGGIYNGSSGTAIIDNSTITRNGNDTLYYGGGGIYNAGTLKVSGSTISGNSAEDGAGIYGSVTMTDSIVIGNGSLPTSRGGGLWVTGLATVVNSAIVGNYAVDGGGGINVSDGSTLVAVSSTITGNETADDGGGICAVGSEYLYNVIVANNGGFFADIYGAIDGGYHNLIGDGTGMTGLVDGENGNQVGTTSSLFVDAQKYSQIVGSDSTFGTADDGPWGDYHLVPGATAVDAGSNLYLDEIDSDGDGPDAEIDLNGSGTIGDYTITTDLGGDQRVWNVVDMGAYESDAKPILGPIGDKGVDELSELTFTATATDEDSPDESLEFSLVGAPTGAEINGETGAFSWTPTEEQDGEHTFTVVVSDGVLTDEEEITVTVAEVNVAPELGEILDEEVDELVELTVTVTATDDDLPEQALVFSLVDAPTGAAINAETGVFSWTPTEAQDGEHTFTVKVSDGEATDEEEITVTVAEVNVAPVLDEIGDQDGNVQSELTFTATATDVDLAAQTLEFSLTDAPDGAAIDGSTGEFSWTPTADQAGDHTFTVVVSDGELDADEEITVTVDPNLVPVLDPIGDQEVNELDTLSFTVTATDEDELPEPLAFSLVGAPTGAEIDSATGVFSWTPTEAQDGEHTFTVVVSDGQATDEEEITVTVAEVNLAPVMSEVGDQEVDELVELSLTVTATDDDLPEQALEFSLVGAPDGAAIDAETGVFSWTPTEEQDGEYTFTVKVSDGEATDEEEITVTVAEVNVAPVLDEIGDQNGNVQSELAFTAVANDVDVPEQDLTFSLTDAPTGAAIDGSTGEFSWTPTADQAGDHTFTVVVSDGELTADEEITVTVSPNLVPALDPIGNKGVNELDTLSFTVTATDEDDSPEALAFSLVGAPDGAEIDGSTGEFNWTPAEDQDGPHTFTVVVSDGQATDEEEITVTVAEVNVAPALDEVDAQSVDELVELTLTVTATDDDLPEQTLEFSLVNAPTGAAIDAETGVFSWAPMETQDGEHTVTVMVSDGEATDEAQFTVTVAEVNEAPVLDEIGAQNGNVQSELTFTAMARDDDVPAQTLEFSLTGEPTGAEIDAATGEFSWTPTADQTGDHTFTVVVSDGELTDTEEITVTVDANLVPVVDPIEDKEVNELEPLSFTVTATDDDGPAETLEFSLVGAPDGAEIDAATGVFNWTPTEAQDGPHTFTVAVFDGQATGEQEITVTVAEVNVAPVLDEIADQEVAELATLEFTATATDVDVAAQTLTFSLVDAPAGAAIDGETGEFSWTPTEEQDGEHTFTVVVSDGEATGTEEITVTVAEVNEAPVLDEIGTQEVDELSELTFTATATDADLAAQTLVFSLVDAPAGAAIDGATGEFSWTPGEAQDGQHTFTVVVSDGELTDEEEITVTVAEVENDPIDLGTVDFTQLTDLAVNETGHWYQFTTTRAGELSVIATSATGTITASLYDSQGTAPALAVSGETTGRLDLSVEADVTYLLRVEGAATDAVLTIANLVATDGTEIQVYGTAGADHFEFAPTGSYLVTINGVEYHFDDTVYETIVFTGSEGDDAATLTGGAGDEVARLFPDNGEFAGDGFLVTVDEVTAITVHGGGGADFAQMYDSPGDDEFITRKGYGKLSGDGFALETFDFMFTYGYAMTEDGGTDVATMEDTADADKFKFDWPTEEYFFGKMYGGGQYYNRAKNFEQINAVMTEGENTVRLFDSVGNDTFHGQKEESQLTGEGFDVTVSGYDSLSVIASTGVNIAHLEDSTDNDTTRARRNKITLWGEDDEDPTYVIMARNFDEYRFTGGNGGSDLAKLHDTAYSDHVHAKEETVNFYMNDGKLDRLYEVVAFDRVKLYATDNGNQHTLEQEGELDFSLEFDDEALWDEV